MRALGQGNSRKGRAHWACSGPHAASTNQGSGQRLREIFFSDRSPTCRPASLSLTTFLTAMAAESQPTRKVAFITGVTGQDGSYLSEFLLEKGYEVHGALFVFLPSLFSEYTFSRAQRKHYCSLPCFDCAASFALIISFCCILGRNFFHYLIRNPSAFLSALLSAPRARALALPRPLSYTQASFVARPRSTRAASTTSMPSTARIASCTRTRGTRSTPTALPTRPRRAFSCTVRLALWRHALFLSSFCRVHSTAFAHVDFARD